MSKGLGQKIAIKFTEKLIDPGYISSDINVALNKPVTSDKTLTPQNTSSGITNGNTATANYVSGGAGLTYVQIDLEEIVMLDKITVWHYYSDSRKYYETKVEISADGETWITIFDSANSGTYTETSAGKTHSFTPAAVRYIRDWLNGSTKNTGNHWVEIKAFSMVKAFDKNGFIVTGQQRKHIGGSLIDGSYIVDKVERYPIESEVPPPYDDLLITMYPLGRFNNVEGNLKVSYDASKGNLAGRGGALESFEVEFLPEDLVPLPNPIVDQGKFAVNAGTIINFTQINYLKAIGKETFTVILSCTVAFILAETINP